MIWLLKLYPGKWRRRYGAEFEEVVASQPRTLPLFVDLQGGAGGAHLKPQAFARQLDGAKNVQRGRSDMMIRMEHCGTMVALFQCQTVRGPREIWISGWAPVSPSLRSARFVFCLSLLLFSVVLCGCGASRTAKVNGPSHELSADRQALALSWPVPGREILSPFGAPRRGHRHTGLDIRGRQGEPVTAAAAGKVVYSGKMQGYGKTVILDHGGGIETLYAHNDRLLVTVGDVVSPRQRIATVGRTGNATTEHCHFEVRRNGVPSDPLSYLGQ